MINHKNINTDLFAKYNIVIFNNKITRITTSIQKKSWKGQTDNVSYKA